MRHLIIFFLLPLSLALQGQGFRSRYFDPGSSNNVAKAIIETTANNYIAGGFTTDNVSSHLCIMGLNGQGQVLWTKKYGNEKFEYLENGFITRSYFKHNNYLYYTGSVRDSLNNQIGVLIKFNMNGDTLWQKIYRDLQEDVIPQMVTASVDGGFLITGFFQNWSNNTNPCMLIKTDANGNELWRQKVNKTTPNLHDGKAIVQDTLSKKIVIAGYQYIGNVNAWGSYDNILILDSLGVKLTQLQYTNSNGSVLFDLVQTRDKKFVAVGKIRQPQMIGAIETDKSFAVKFDIDTPNNPIWTLSFDMYSQDHLFSCINEFSNGDLLLSGHIDTMLRHNLNENLRVRLTRIDKNANIIWNKYYDYSNTTSPFYESVACASIGSDNSILAAIQQFNFPSPNPFFFVKFDSTGCDSSLAYCQSQVLATGIYENKFKNVKVVLFPNPVQDQLTIVIGTGGAETQTELSITDVSGREVKKTLLATEKNTVDLKGLSNGVYMISISRDKEVLYKTKLAKQE